VGEVDALTRLVRRTRLALETNKERVEQNFTGDTRRGRRNWVYLRDRQPCRRCGTPIEVALLGPETRERTTYWCPTCQPR
jgi:endonuclease-8